MDPNGSSLDPWKQKLSLRDAASALIEYALLADAAYSNKSVVGNWQKTMTLDQLNSYRLYVVGGESNRRTHYETATTRV